MFLELRPYIAHMKIYPKLARGLLRRLLAASAYVQIQRHDLKAALHEQPCRHGGVHPARQPEYNSLHRHTSLYFFASTHTISAATSAGDTPDMREARPKFSGLIFASFCLASRRRPSMQL